MMKWDRNMQKFMVINAWLHSVSPSTSLPPSFMLLQINSP